MNAGAGIDVAVAAKASSVLRTLALCDLVNSTALVERLGDLVAAELIRKHDRLARTLADRHGGHEIDKTDGFMMMFDRPIQAVAFALDYQRGLRQLNAAEKTELSARVGIHVGDVVVWDNSAADIAKGAKPIEVEGLVKPITSRLMSLALPGQILLSNIAYALAHRAQGELGDLLEKVRWRTHGRYRFRGVPDPVPVFEVGEEGMAPLKAPPWSSKAHREVPFWRRPATVVIEGLVMVALLAIPIVMFLRPDPAIAFANRDWVVVGNLNNLTGETVFDEALESALRIGLEQSRYVNVLPDLKVRDTVKRMQRDPDTTKVNREVGSEVAIRDGARALILPTIAEIGGRVRITAEVIDPQTQTTVYSETADGIGKESILPSLDTINSRLRVRLGEALATVSSESKPLEEVATKNLDALRAYSLAIKANTEGDIDQAVELLLNATAIDPEFSRARISLGSSLLIQGKRTEAEVQFQLALANPTRLSTRDKLMAEAWLAGFSSQNAALQKARALALSYPDLFFSQGAYAYYAWTYANDFSAAMEAVQRNVVEKNPNRGTGLYLFGTLLLGAERYPEALEKFQQSEELGTKYQNYYYAAWYATQREFEKVGDVIARGRSTQSPDDGFTAGIFDIAFAVDQGNWSATNSLLTSSLPKSASLNETKAQALEDARLVLRASFASDRDRIKLVELLADYNENTAEAKSGLELADWNTSLLFRAWTASRYANSDVSEKFLVKAGPIAGAKDFPVQVKIRGLIEARTSLSDGKIDDCIAQLRKLVDGTELYVTHLELMDALAQKGDISAARDEARWLATHRGRAYTEVVAELRFIPFNVAVSDIARLNDAEFSIKMGDLIQAKKSLKTFGESWPFSGLPPQIAERVRSLELEIAESTKSPSAGDL